MVRKTDPKAFEEAAAKLDEDRPLDDVLRKIVKPQKRTVKTRGLPGKEKPSPR